MIPHRQPPDTASAGPPVIRSNPGTGGRFCFALLCCLFLLLPNDASAADLQSVSLKTYKLKSFAVPNPMDLSRLPMGKTFQVAEDEFILQFYFDGRDIYGIIFKRQKEVSLYIEWCFFKSCEESQYDYVVKIADANKPPFDQQFFSVKLPAHLAYEFKGLKFFTWE